MCSLLSKAKYVLAQRKIIYVLKPDAEIVVSLVLSRGGAHFVHTAWFAGKTTPCLTKRTQDHNCQAMFAPYVVAHCYCNFIASCESWEMNSFYFTSSLLMLYNFYLRKLVKVKPKFACGCTLYKALYIVLWNTRFWTTSTYFPKNFKWLWTTLQICLDFMKD